MNRIYSEPKLLIVDDEPNNLKLMKQILQNDYSLLFAVDGQKAIDAAHKHKPSLILLDIMMPGISGYEVCRRLKQDKATESIPIIFLTAMGDVDAEAKGFDLGAVDYLSKPVSPPIVKRRVRNHLSLVRSESLEQLAVNAIRMLGEAGHYNDTDTGQHIWRMAEYSYEIALALGWSSGEAGMLKMAAPMHDTGKIGIPDAILKAPRSLTEAEWVIMRNHTVIGHKILSNSDNAIFQMAADVALYHHEKWDGSGYPSGLKEQSIPECARIVAVADVFDALTMKRPYKEPWSTDKAFETIKQGAGSHFDPRIVEVFLTIKDKILTVKAERVD